MNNEDEFLLKLAIFLANMMGVIASIWLITFIVNNDIKAVLALMLLFLLSSFKTSVQKILNNEKDP